MIRNYLTIAVRSLLRHKIFSFINIFGLSLGIGCTFLIALFLKHEWTYDTFHTNASSIYRAYVKEDYGDNEKFFNTVTPFPLGPALKDNVPQVKHHVRINTIRTQLSVNEKVFSEAVTVVDPSFFQVFDFSLVQGDKTSVLTQANDIVLTEDTAIKLFGSTDVMGKTVALALETTPEEFTVKGVVANIPQNSSIQFGSLISSLNYPKLYSERALTSGWFNVTPETYVLLEDGVSPVEVESMLPPVFKSILGDDYETSKYFVGLQPLTDIHLNNEFPQGNVPVSNPKYGWILAGVAVLILFLACINFVTLSIGRTIKRAREVGIRKVVGAAKFQLIIQFIGEAVLVTFIALMVGVAIAAAGLPTFNDLAGLRLRLELNSFTILTSAALVVIIGLFAGSYPAFVLSRFIPVAILKGKLQGNSNHGFRKVLVSIQLVLAVFLISTTIVMQRQLSYLMNKDLGFNKNQVLVTQMMVPNEGKLVERVKVAFEKAELMKAELRKNRNVITAASASHDFGRGGWTHVGYTDDKGVYRGFYLNLVDADFLPGMNIKLVKGRNFSSENTSDASRAIIVNEAFVKELGWENPIGMKIPGKDFVDHEIIGVVENFNYNSLYTKVDPLVIAMNPLIPLSGSENVNIENSPIPKLFVHVQGGQVNEGIAAVENTWKKVAGEDPFEFTFLDESIAAQYKNDQSLARIISITTVLSVVIGGLGLYALSSLAIQGRVKEISIRKVLGASVRSIMLLLSREYVYLALINITLSIPLTIFFVREWLLSFEYRVDIHWMVFVIAAGIALSITFFTISFEMLKASLAQPADKLKNE